MRNGRIERNRRSYTEEIRREMVLAAAQEVAHRCEEANSGFFKRVSKASGIPLREVRDILEDGEPSSALPFRETEALMATTH